jgi:hypothetical protein
MKKAYKYGLLLLSLGFLGYHSVYFKKLSEVRAQEGKAFDYQAFADSLYYQDMLKKDVSIGLPELLTAIKTDVEGAFAKYGNRLGIGNSAYFMVKCSGSINAINEDAILLKTEPSGDVSINTTYIFGNALRDASGLVKLTDFKTNAEFNKVSEALNALIRKKVIPPLKEGLKLGDEIEVIGAVKLSKKDWKQDFGNLEAPSLTITPAQITPR